MHAAFSGAGKGKQEVCANKERKYECEGKGVCAGRGRERKVLVKDANREGAGREEKEQRKNG